MTNPELHFGAVLGLGTEETASEAQLLEALGYEYTGTGEHFSRGEGGPTHSQASIPVLAVAAGATTTIRVVSTVILLPFYHPTILARLTSSLDIASGGRLTLGVGVGGEFPAEFEHAGISSTQRGGRSNECLEAVKKLWTRESVDYDGRYYNLSGVTSLPHPTQEPHPPIWVAGRREPAMRRAVRYGNGWFPYLYSPERYRESVEKITAMAAEEGRDLADFQWANYQFISINDSREEAARIAASQLGRGYRYSGDFKDIVGSYCVLGTPEECVQRLQEYVDAGARYFLLSWVGPMEDRAAMMETAASQIIPQLKA